MTIFIQVWQHNFLLWNACLSGCRERSWWKWSQLVDMTPKLYSRSCLVCWGICVCSWGHLCEQISCDRKPVFLLKLLPCNAIRPCPGLEINFYTGHYKTMTEWSLRVTWPMHSAFALPNCSMRHLVNNNLHTTFLSLWLYLYPWELYQTHFL